MNSAAENQMVIESFYSSFQVRDHAGMIACYHPDVQFSDPVFTDLRGKQAMAMWHMLCERGRDLAIEFRGVAATDTAGKAHWEVLLRARAIAVRSAAVWWSRSFVLNASLRV